MNRYTRRLFLQLLGLFPILRRLFAPAPEVVIDTMPDRGEQLLPRVIWTVGPVYRYRRNTETGEVEYKRADGTWTSEKVPYRE